MATNTAARGSWRRLEPMFLRVDDGLRTAGKGGQVSGALQCMLWPHEASAGSVTGCCVLLLVSETARAEATALTA